MKYTFTTSPAAVSRVQERAATLNRKAVKLGLAPIMISVSEPYTVFDDTAEYALDCYKTVVDVTVEGEVIRKNGFKLIGMITKDTVTDTNMVAAIGGDVPESFFTVDRIDCDHCNRIKNRNSGFIYQNDESGEYIMVGKSCSKEFNGIMPSAVEFLGGINRQFDDCRGFNSPTVHKTAEMLNFFVAEVRENGYLSKSVAMERGMVSTSDTVMRNLTDPQARKALVIPTDADKAKAELVLAWAKGHFVATNTEFAFNMKTTVNAEFIGNNRLGFLAYTVAAHDKAMQEKVVKQDVVDAFVGEVGQRRVFEGKFVAETSYPSDFGTVWVARFETNEGVLVCKTTSPFYCKEGVSISFGDVVKFKATIKEHKVYRDQKQTIIQRGVMV